MPGYIGVVKASGPRAKFRARSCIAARCVSLGFHDNAEVAARMYDVASLRLRGPKLAMLNFPASDYDLDAVAQLTLSKVARGARLDKSARSAILDLALSAHQGHPILQSTELSPTTPAPPDCADTCAGAGPEGETPAGSAPGVDVPGDSVAGVDTCADEAPQRTPVTEVPQLIGESVLAHLQARAFQEFCAQDAFYPPPGDDADSRMPAIEPDRIRAALEVWRRALLLDEAAIAQSAAEAFRDCVASVLCSTQTARAYNLSLGVAGATAADASEGERTVTLLTLMWVLNDALLSAADTDVPVKLAFLDPWSPHFSLLEPHSLPRATATKTALHRSLIFGVCREAAAVPECGLHLMLGAAENLLNNMNQITQACVDRAVFGKEDWCLWLISLLRLLTPPFCGILERYARSAMTAAADPFGSRDKVRNVLAACLAIDSLAREGGHEKIPALHPVIFHEWCLTWAPIRATVRDELRSAQVPLPRDVQSLLLLRTEV